MNARVTGTSNADTMFGNGDGNSRVWYRRFSGNGHVFEGTVTDDGHFEVTAPGHYKRRLIISGDYEVGR